MFWNEEASQGVQDAEIIETEIALLIRKLMRVDLYYSDRVLRAAKRRDVIETKAH